MQNWQLVTSYWQFQSRRKHKTWESSVKYSWHNSTKTTEDRNMYFWRTVRHAALKMMAMLRCLACLTDEELSPCCTVLANLYSARSQINENLTWRTRSTLGKSSYMMVLKIPVKYPRTILLTIKTIVVYIPMILTIQLTRHH